MHMIKTNQPSLVTWQASPYKYDLDDIIKLMGGHSQRALLDDLWQMVEEVPLDELSCNELDVRLKQEWDSIQAKKRKLARQSTRGWGKNRGFDGYHNGK